MDEVILELAQMGLQRAARLLEKKGTAKARKLAKALRAADAGITAYQDDQMEVHDC